MSRSLPPRPHPSARPLTGPADALSVIVAAASNPPRPETICLLVDRAHCGIACVVVIGAAPIDEIAQTMLLLADAEPSVAAVVLASVRPGPKRQPQANDHFVFDDLRTTFDDAGLDLLDWFVLDGRRAASMAELTDSQSRWRSP